MRGPVGSIVESPDALIKEAYREKRVVEFDWIARASVSRAALSAGLSSDDLLFLNIEPLALASDAPPDLWPVIDEAFQKLQVILEVTERSLDRDPSTLLEGIDRQRPTVSGLALDDVGADVRTMSMLPALEPDVIKLDLKVTQRALSRKAMKILDFVYEEVERTDATVLAEGVETKRHEQVVRELGCPLAQGWLYGKPTDQPAPTGQHQATELLERNVALEEVRTPFEVLGGHTISHASTELLHSFADQVFIGGMHLLDPALALMLVPSPRTPRSARARRAFPMGWQARRGGRTRPRRTARAGTWRARFVGPRSVARRRMGDYRPQPKHRCRDTRATDPGDQVAVRVRCNP